MENKHTEADLAQMQSLPLSAKILMTQRRIREWYEHWDGMVYVSFSGGKDSTVLKHLVENTPGVYDVPSVFVNTGLEYPEIQRFAMNQPNVNKISPKMRFDEVIKTYGYPVIGKEVARRIRYARKGAKWALLNMKGLNAKGEPHKYIKGLYAKWEPYVDGAPFAISDQCCEVMKENPIDNYAKETGRKPIIGTMASESQRRRKAWKITGCNAFDAKKPASKPMSFWTGQDVLQYIVENGIEYASVYGEIKQDANGRYYTTGLNRTGCMFCMFGCHREGSPNRFQRMYKTHPRQYDYCMKPMEDGGLGLREVLEYIGVNPNPEPEQMCIFVMPEETGNE